MVDYKNIISIFFWDDCIVQKLKCTLDTPNLSLEDERKKIIFILFVVEELKKTYVTKQLSLNCSDCIGIWNLFISKTFFIKLSMISSFETEFKGLNK